MTFSTTSILGSDKIIEAYGYWPMFHDDEIVAVNIDTTGLTISIDCVTRPDSWDRNPRIDFVFTGIESLELIDWYHQNVIFDLSFSMENNLIKLIISASVGISGEITAKNVQVSMR